MGFNVEVEAKQLQLRLQAHGEAFMHLFDDHDEAEPLSTWPATVGEAGVGVHSPPADEVSPRSAEGSSGGGHEGLKLVVHESKRLLQTRQLRGRGRPVSSLSMQKQRRLFLSGRSVDSASITDGRKSGKRKPSLADALSAADFETMRREVDMLGASELDKRQRKEFEANMLKGMKAKAEKGPRMPASIGLGLAKKRKEREKAAFEQAVDAGMMQFKGAVKKRMGHKGKGSKKRQR